MFTNKKLARMALNMSLSKEVRDQDSIFIPTNMRNNPINKVHRTQYQTPPNPQMSQLFLEWMLKNWKSLMEIFPANNITLKQYVSLLTIEKDKKTRDKLKSFFDKKENRRDDILNIIAIAFENIDSNIHFMQVNGLSK